MLLPLVLIVVITTVDILSPPEIHLGPLLVVAPAITASFAGARLTALVSLLAVAALTVIGFLRDGVTTANHETQIAGLVIVSAVVVSFTALRDRHARELTRVRSVAEAAQRVLMRPLPSRLGPLRIASVYLAAEAEAQVGGDLYAAVRTATGTRLIVGDVRGKGLASLEEASLLLGAFRAAAHLQASLPDLAAHLDGSVSWDLAGDRGAMAGAGAGAGAGADAGEDGEAGRAQAGTDREAGESFITAVLLDIPDDGSTIQVINCGHPPPMLLRQGRVLALEARRPAPPLGLGGLLEADYHADEFPFAPGDRLLIYTDGVIEARDTTRAFYPLADRLRGWTADPPGPLLQHLQHDLLAHAGGHLGDDAAMVAVERVGRPSDPGGAAGGGAEARRGDALG
ncbi:serine/threonine-protein phosphatase [Kitasatospora sp. NBC_01287]|uniref:PP2C family protein-serine/threonine phosphatase n=1 Tax=Kitasatospora sp. NBC_01287 TaxID=2903573 RepID=UPI00224DB6EE|nr:PP2C family protein-serine/threonine phosphatase [Kitasatospora sp. NBC_01287]MCX4745553.1 serine/threonine-protein phosphatase [Kitasatospora sp. NBC_01287]